MAETIPSFYVVGISLQSTNENDKSIEDMGVLWGRFYSEDISSKIQNKASHDVYSVFTDYESDFRGRYRAIIGHKVKTVENVPEGLIAWKIPEGKYQKFISKGKMPNAIVDSWKEIWEKDAELNRAYRADFEVYTEKSNQGNQSEVEIYLGIN